MYDEQGSVDEEGEALRGERDWQEYWRLLFKKVRTGLGVEVLRWGPAGLTSAGWHALWEGEAPCFRVVVLSPSRALYKTLDFLMLSPKSLW